MPLIQKLCLPGLFVGLRCDKARGSHLLRKDNPFLDDNYSLKSTLQDCVVQNWIDRKVSDFKFFCK